MAETQNSKQNVQAPQAGQTVVVNAIPGQDIVLEAAFDQAEVKMDGGNVVFEFANGGQVVLDFTDLGEAQAPNVVMPDGTVLNMQEFLASLGEGDIEPAAGPEGGADGSGGVGEYQDDAGDLLGGVNKLNGLEDDPFPAFTLASIDAVDDNPLPTAGIVGGAVDEDGLRLSEGAHFDGNDDEAGGDNPARFSYLDGTLTYDFGGDGPADTNPFAWSLVGLPVVFSEGNQLVYEVVDGGLTLNAYYMTEGEPYFPPQGEGDYMYARVEEGPVRVDVFSLKLTDLDNGTFRFELYQPLDHSDTTTEDDINYGFTFTVTDGSGDSVVGGLNLAIDDDSPIARDVRPIERTVDEDDILTDLSTGNHPNDGDWKDGSFTGNPYLGWGDGPANIWGSLKSLVSFGADGKGENGFSLSEDLAALNQQAVESKLTSQGGQIQYRLVNGGITLQAYVSSGQGGGDDSSDDAYQAFRMQEPGDGSNDRVVFELWLDSDGNYKFKLFDQVDHYAENGDSLPIDLSSAIVATDGDGDSITLESGFVIKVTDDAPKLAGYEHNTVAENDIDTKWSEGTSPNDGKGWYFNGKDWHYDGSFTGDPDNNAPGAAYVHGDLSDVVKFGADEMGSFRFSSDALQKLFSTDFNFWGQAVGVPLDYRIVTNEETGIDTLVGFEKFSAPGWSNPVFELKLDTQTGEYEFLLHDELRHTGDQSESIKINFGALIEAVDNDGDAISLNGRFEIKVVDDVPEPVIRMTGETVVHDETPGIQDPDDTNSGWATVRFIGIRNPGDDPDVDASPIGYAKSDSAVVTTEGSEAGADHLLYDKLSLVVLDSDSGLKTTEGYDIALSVDGWGRIVGRVADDDAGQMNNKAAFAIALGSDGKLYLAQYLSIQHGNSDNPNDLIGIAEGKIVVRYEMTDTDGDTRHDDADIGAAVQFADDGPSIGLNALVRLDDDALDNGITGGIDDNIDSKHVSGKLAHDFGADGGSISWLTNGAPEGFTYEVSEDGELLNVVQVQDGKIVLTLTLDSETGDYNVAQNNPILHADGNDENNQRFVVRYKVADGDDDSVVGKIKISVDDDTPVIEDQPVQILSESFESFATISENAWTVVGEGGGTISGNDGVVWTVNSAGIEIQSGNVGGSTASDGQVHAELDAHDSQGNGGTTLTTLSTAVELPSSEVTMTFDYRPRPDDKGDSGMTVSLGGIEVKIESDASGNISITSGDGVVASYVPSFAQGWTSITLAFSGLVAGTGQLVVSGLSDHVDGNTLGAYLDNINMYADRAVLTVDETTLDIDATADLSGFFAGKFGADGPGELKYALGLDDEYDPDSLGLVDTASGENVILSVNGDGVVEGRTENGDELVFKVLVNEDSGVVKLDQLRAVEHADPDNADEPLNLEGMVKLTATITDADNDSASDSIDVKLVFHDDGPEANGAQNVVIANVVGTSETIPPVTNVILTLDLSGSMAGDKLAASVAAMTSVIQKYDDAGVVNVQITTFGTNAGPSSGWLDANAAIAALQGFSAYTDDARMTNYEAAIHHTIRGDGPDDGTATDVRPNADQTVAYFVTDGEPNREYSWSTDTAVDPQANPTVGTWGDLVDTNYVSAWQSFIGANVNHLFVVAVETPANDSDLLKLVDGVTPLAGGTVRIVEVTDTDNMVQILEGTVITDDPAPVSATASLGIDIGADGWGGAQISDVATMADGSDTVRYVTGVAANGDAIIATSGGVKLVYEDDGNGGLVAVTDDAARKVVFEVSLDQQPDGTPIGTYTVTMIGTVDPYVVAGESKTSSTSEPLVTETPGLPVSLTKTDSLTFFGTDNAGGGKARTLDITKFDADTGITLNIQATGEDHRLFTNEQADYVNWSESGIGVGNNSINNPNSWLVPSETLKLVITAANLPSGVTGIKIDSIDLVFDKLDNDETASWDVSPGSVNDDSIGGFGNGSNEANDIPVNIVLGSGSIGEIEFSANNGDSYRIDPGTGIKVNYSYIIDVPTTVVETKTVTTETTNVESTAYDITLIYKVGVTDGDNDYTSSDFHVTIDANNDGIMHSVGSDTIVGNADVQSSSTITTVINTHVYYNDGGTIVDVSNDTVTSVTNASSSSNVSVVASDDNADLMETVGSLIDPTDDDVMVAGDDQDYAMFGGGGDDVLLGGDGDDFLVGNTGADIMTGGAGSDSFEPANSADTITDFDDGIDTMLTTINPELP